MTKRTFLLSAAFTFLLFAPVAVAQSYYNHAFLWTAAGGMQDLGVPSGWTDTAGSAISSYGVVVGNLDNSLTGNQRAAAWSAKTGWRILKNEFRAPHISAAAVNTSLQIVGSYTPTITTAHAFLWTQAGGMQDLGTLGGDFSVAYGINRSGQVVGASNTTPGGFEHAFLWTQSGGMQDLGALNAGSNSGSVAYAINDNGVIVGSSNTNDGFPVAVLWKGGQIYSLGLLGSRSDVQSSPAAQSEAFGINNHGQVVGTSSTSQNPRHYPHAFLWTAAGGMQDLGVLPGGLTSYAQGINDSGVVVGWNFMSSGTQAFVWTTAGGMQGIGSLGGPYSQAYGINDSGQVVGWSSVK